MNKVAIMSIIGVMVVAGSGTYFLYKQHSKTYPPIDSTGGQEITIDRAEDKLYYLQNDPQWGNDRIGGSDETMGRVGCTVCCVAMSLTNHGYSIDPKRLNEDLKKNKGYTKQGWLIWGKVSDITDGKFGVRIPGKPSHKIIDDQLKNGNDVLAKILINKVIPHWVLIVDKDGLEYLAKDPLNGEKKIIKLSKYKSPIYSIRYIAKKE